MEGKSSELAVVKQKVRLQEWSAQVEAQQASGLNVREWCASSCSAHSRRRISCFTAVIAVVVSDCIPIPPRVSLKHSKLVHWTNLDCLKLSKEVQ